MSRRIRNILIVLCITVISMGLEFSGFLQTLDNRIYDQCFRIRGPRVPGGQIVIIAMDEPSYQVYGPYWERSTHAELLTHLGQARLVVFDITFENQTPDDRAFVKAINEQGRVILPFKASLPGQSDLQVVLPLAPYLDSLEGVTNIGGINTPTDSDGVIRRVILSYPYIDPSPPSLSLAIYESWAGIDHSEVSTEGNKIRIGEEPVPMAANYQSMPEFYGPAGTFTTISYKDVMTGQYDGQTEYFKNKIVMIGPTTQEEHDSYLTPFTTSNLASSGSRPVPGVEIQAGFVQSLIDSIWRSEAPWWVMALLIASLAWISVCSMSGRRPAIRITILIAILGVTAGAGYASWLALFWIPPVALLLVPILGYLLVTTLDFLEAELNRLHLKRAFSRYVDESVLEEILENRNELGLGGKRADLTVMFLDIRGFTAYSENKDPENVVSRLNEYLSAARTCIFKRGGTLDKYLGDGLMAFFGAPMALPEHAEMALLCALDIEEEFESLNRKWQETGEPPFRIGIGLNSGPVLAGNVGSPERMDYTIMGENVNLAARLESLTKELGVSIVLSDRCLPYLKRSSLAARLVYLRDCSVKGFSEPIPCWTYK